MSPNNLDSSRSGSGELVDTNPQAEIINKAQNDLKSDFDLGFRPSGTSPEQFDRHYEKKSEIEKRFNRLHKAGIVNGKSDSDELASKFSWTEIGGRESHFGDALFDDEPMRGLDVVRSGKFLKTIVPIKERARYVTSLYQKRIDLCLGPESEYR